MATWRRLAIEAVPSCKRAIEGTRRASDMWQALYSGLYNAYEVTPPDEETIRRIYVFALACNRRSPPEGAEHLAWWVSVFFDSVFSDKGRIGSDVGSHVPLADFDVALDIVSLFPPQRITEIRRRSHATHDKSHREKAVELKDAAKAEAKKKR